MIRNRFLERFLSPIKDLKVLIKLIKIFLNHNFEIVHNFTIEPNIYGAIAAKMAGVNKIIERSKV